MAFDPTRNQTVYQKPQDPSQFGTQNTNPAYNVNIAANNPGVAPTVTPNPGFGTQQAPPASTTTGGGGGGAPTNNYTDAPLAGPGYNEDWYKTYGQDLMKSPSASEDLYSRGVAGSNPYYDYAEQQATRAINNAAAARGGWNSSYALKQIGDSTANIRGQQAHELDMLANQADQAKFGRYDRGQNYAESAQNSTERRITGGVNAYTGLANNQADKVGSFYMEGGREATQSEMAAIEAQLKAAGLTSQEAKQMMDEAGSIAGLFAKLYGMGGMSGGGGGNGMGGGSGIAPSGG